MRKRSVARRVPGDQPHRVGVKSVEASELGGDGNMGKTVIDTGQIDDDELMSEGNIRPLDHYGSVELGWVLRPLHQDARFVGGFARHLHGPVPVRTMRAERRISSCCAGDEKLFFKVSALSEIAKIPCKRPAVSTT